MLFNPAGVAGLNKRREIEDYAEKRSIMIAAIPETQHAHTSEGGGTQMTTPDGELVGGMYKWFYGSGIDPKVHEELLKLKKAGKKADKTRKKELINQAREHGGVAIMIHKNLWKHIEKIETVGSRLLRCRMKFRKKLDIIVAYGQQANKSLQEKQQFYNDLQKMIEDTPPRHMLLVAGDFNAKMHKATNGTEEVIGKFPLYDEENFQKMAEETKTNRRLIFLPNQQPENGKHPIPKANRSKSNIQANRHQEKRAHLSEHARAG